jgi:SAM-dependent methyltransferase
MDLEKVYTRRFNVDERTALAGVWKVLVDHCLMRWIKPDAAVLDFGAGYCNFINQVAAPRRIAVDANPAVAGNCAPGVHFILAGDLPSAGLEGTQDVVFMSNVLEHLDNAEAVLATLKAVHTLLKPGGRAIILQPNFALVGPAYFDFLDHKVVLTDKSLVEALELTGFQMTHLRRRFLPYTSKSSMPSAPWMVRLYLMMPPAQWLMGKQTLAIAEKPA